jgi:hypothetical protein
VVVLPGLVSVGNVLLEVVGVHCVDHLDES